MARKAQFPPRITRHHTGQARCHWAGQDYYLGPYGSEEAQANYVKLLAQLSGPDGAPLPAAGRATLTVAAGVALFLEHVGPTYDPAGQELAHIQYACRPLLRLYADLEAGKLGPPELEALQQAMAHGTWEGARPGGWAASTVNRHVARIKTIWRWLERKGHLPRGTYAGLKAVPRLSRRDRSVRHAPRRQPSTRAELDAVLPHVQSKRTHRPVATMLEVQWLAGMRSCEVRLMRPCDIDRDGPMIEGVKVWLYRPHRHKTQHLGHDRVVMLGPACQQLLAPWLLGCAPESYLFRPRGRPLYSPNGYCRAVNAACQRAGVKLVAYQGRHSAKDRATREFDLDSARCFLGQVSISVTDSYGSQADQRTAALVAAKLA